MLAALLLPMLGSLLVLLLQGGGQAGGPGGSVAEANDAHEPCPAAGAVRVLDSDQVPRRPTDLPPPSPDDYRDRIRPTPAGWARRSHWCVWVEPIEGTEAALVWQRRWLGAVNAALGTWERQLPISRVDDPEQAQVRLYRRRPPLLGDGRRRRASHGRAVLVLVETRRQSEGPPQLEPRVEVLISPDQRQPSIQATALHELGHAFGLWGHSNDPADAMAAVPGAAPVLVLSPRDQATLRWLQQQPGLGDAPLIERAPGLTPAAAPRDGRPAPPAPGAS
ncbi:peptidase [Cyanobium sp. Morenito 9A2]|uniref:peptidase n=1 Tax=Cyanobium sp. Morenito 9A2 TaxID=2823718 RepID=UPI0020CDE349|nr:peptidase [Cyanobium sp. Morenito 9A2]MCP9848452.1 peptidase [Cyanobium sp. Morenito 9A2]